MRLRAKVMVARIADRCRHGLGLWSPLGSEGASEHSRRSRRSVHASRSASWMCPPSARHQKTGSGLPSGTVQMPCYGWADGLLMHHKDKRTPAVSAYSETLKMWHVLIPQYRTLLIQHAFAHVPSIPRIDMQHNLRDGCTRRVGSSQGQKHSRGRLGEHPDPRRPPGGLRGQNRDQH